MRHGAFMTFGVFMTFGAFMTLCPRGDAAPACATDASMH
jgi:hypothetical protein